MYKQHRPRLSGSTLFAIPIIFIFILCIYIIKMSLHIKCMYKQGIPKPAPSAISPIAMLLHHHNGPLYWDTEVVYITRMAHVLGQKCMHKQCRPRLDQGLHYLAYRQYLYVILEDSRINLFEFKCSDNMAKCLNTQSQSVQVDDWSFPYSILFQ